MKKYIISILILLVALSTMGLGTASAWYGCGQSYTVQPGDTLFSIARGCGYSLSELQNLNPDVGYWIYPGQIIYFYQQYYSYPVEPIWQTGGFYYTVEHGDTLFKIATRYGMTTDSLMVANSLTNRNFIYTGQVLYIPGSSGGYYPQPLEPQQPLYYEPTYYGSQQYVVQRGETLKILASRWGISLYELMRLNPQIYNADMIYAGQTIYSPYYQTESYSNYYVVQSGDTMKKIAGYFGITLYDLMVLNPSIWNPNLIYVGTSIRVQ